MSSSFDPYQELLGILDPERPPNPYRLLGIEPFESNDEVIAAAADHQIARLEPFQHGPRSDHSTCLATEVMAAKAFLLDPSRKAALDDYLKRQQSPEIRPADSTTLMDEHSNVVIRSEPARLRMPGRGPRAERPWFVSTAVLLPVLIIVILLVAYRIYRDHRGSKSSIDDSIASAENEPPGAAPAQNAADPTEATASIETGAPDSNPSDAHPTGTSPSNSNPSNALGGGGGIGPVAGIAPANESAADMPKTGALTTVDQRDATPPNTPSADASQDVHSDVDVEHMDSTPASQTNRERRAPEDAADPENPGGPARFSTHHPMGAFLLALAQRDFAAADSALSAIEATEETLGGATSAGLEAHLIRETIEQFWRAVESAAAKLEPNEELIVRGVPWTVIDRDEENLQLTGVSAKSQPFHLEPSKINSELAVALVQKYHATSPPIGWRLIATFLSIDHEGDVTRASQFSQQAEQHGFAADFLLRIVQRLSGEP